MKIQIIFVCIILFNILSHFYFNSKFKYEEKNVELTNSKLSADKPIKYVPTFSFNDPPITYNLLKKLLKDQLLPDKEKITNQQPGIIVDNFYCNKVIFEFAYTALWNLQQKNFVTDYKPDEILRKIVIPSIGDDINLKIFPLTPSRVAFSLPTQTNMLFMHFVFNSNYYLGKNYGCINQLYNHIYDHTKFNIESLTAQAYIDYINSFEDRTQCKFQFMPDSYLLENKQQCLDFFKLIGSNGYKEEKKSGGIIFFLKISEGLHKGLTALDEKLEEKIKNLFENGLKCGEKNDTMKIQKYVPNLLLLNEHEFNFTAYVLVASTNPLIAYYYDGFLKLSEKNSTNKNGHISNYTQVEKKFLDDINETELHEFQTWNFDQLQNHLLANDYINDTDWIRNNFRKQLKEIMVQSLRMSQYVFEKKSQLFGIFEYNFVLDNTLKPWLIEINTTPTLYDPSSTGQNHLVKMLKEMFDIMYAFLRSRMKRIIQLINKVSKDMPMDFEFPPEMYSSIKVGFDAVNINYLDEDFMPSNDNEFQKIIDENFNGFARYSKIIPDECL